MISMTITKADNGWILNYRNPAEHTEIYTTFSSLVDRIAVINGITKLGQTWEMYLVDKRGKEPTT